jgi:hypothetical protein
LLELITSNEQLNPPCAFCSLKGRLFEAMGVALIKNLPHDQAPSSNSIASQLLSTQMSVFDREHTEQRLIDRADARTRAWRFGCSAARRRNRQSVWLVTQHGRPFTVAGFGDTMRQWCDEAGLPHCSAQGGARLSPPRTA